MSDNTLIDWADATWPVVAGCTRVSPGCDNCYAVRNSWRLAHNPNPAIRAAYEGTVTTKWTADLRERLDWTGTVRCLPERLEWPLHWKKPRRIFPCNMSDLFHELVSSKFIGAHFGIIAATPQHTYQVLTKRLDEALEWFRLVDQLAEESHQVFPDESLNWRRWHVLRARAIYHTGAPLPSIPSSNPPWPLPNVWFGATVENQEQADRRIPLLLQVPAAVRWVSVEPMLGPIDLSRWLYAHSGLHPDWVVVGGETGPSARPVHPDWVRSVRDQCQAAGVPFWFKQWGEWLPLASADEADNHPAAPMRESDDGMRWVRVGARRAGHLLDGQEWRQLPEVPNG